MIQTLSNINLESWVFHFFEIFQALCFSQDHVLIQLPCGTARLPRELLDFEPCPGDELVDLVVIHVSPQGAGRDRMG